MFLSDAPVLWLLTLPRSFPGPHPCSSPWQPEKFQNKTNGVTPRRWLLQCNLPLSSLIIERIGEDWITDLTQLSRLNEFIDDESFISDIIAAKLVNKRRLAKWVI